MSTIRTKHAKPSDGGFCVLMLFLLLVWSLVACALYSNNTFVNEKLYAFNARFAPLAKVQKAFNFTVPVPSLTWPAFYSNNFSLGRLGNDSLPEWFHQFTNNNIQGWLLNEKEKVLERKVLERDLQALEKELEALKQFVRLIALGVIFMFVSGTLLIWVLLERTAKPRR